MFSIFDIFNEANFQTPDERLLYSIFIHSIRIIAIILGAYFLDQFGKLFIRNFIKNAVKTDKESRKKRRDTLVGVFDSSLVVIVWIGAAVLVMLEFGFNPAPLLAGVGLLGLAIGMGARSLIQDYLSGIFIISEDQYRVGEKIKIAGIEGNVKELSLRKTILEDEKGIIYFVPNGQVDKVSNYSRKEKKYIIVKKN